MSIKIKKCPATETKEELLISHALHISDVQKGCAFIANKIIEAGINHDHTKNFYIDDFIEENIAAKSGDEFRASKWYQTHITKERHHLNAKCPDDVNLIDVIESLIDCVMASSARGGEGKFYISDEILQKAYQNTVEMLQKEIILEND